MKGLKFEGILLMLTAVTLAFFAGWYLGSGSGAVPYTVTAARAESAQEPAAAAGSAAPGLLPGERININIASAEDLERLPGIGEKRARDIVAYREEHGPFQMVEELTDVSGIGAGTLQGLIDYITVGEE